MKFGPGFREQHTLRDGAKVTLRMIRPSDREALREAIERLSPESRYRRFLSAQAEPSEGMLTYLTEVDAIDHVAIIAVADSLDLKVEQAHGVARFVRLPDEPGVAEAAITVGDWIQGRGLGALLGATLAGAARERGITKFRGEVLASNAPMRRLLEEIGAELRDTGAGSYEFDVSLEDGAPASLGAVLRAVAAQMLEVLQRLTSLGGSNPKTP
jgi:RimJ/RimL family protein N-acetyltransferase